MNVECVNAFVGSSKMVLNQTTQIDVASGQPFIKTGSSFQDTIALIIGLTGEIRGQIAIVMERNTALYIASSMMGGYPVTELDEISSSAVGELLNMIAGNASTTLYNKGISIDITPPSVFQGQNISFYSSVGKVICVPMSLGDKGSVDLDILVKD